MPEKKLVRFEVDEFYELLEINPDEYAVAGATVYFDNLAGQFIMEVELERI